MLQYHITKDGQQIGPLTEQEIASGILTGRFAKEDLVWKEGAADWVPLHAEFPSLRSSGSIPPPAPPQEKKEPPMGCGKIGAWLFLAIIVFFIIGLASDNSDRNKAKANETQANAIPATPRSLGENFKLGGFSYTITSANKTTHIGSSDLEGEIVDALLQNVQKDIGINPFNSTSSFLVIRYTIKNEGTDSSVVSTSDFKVVDSKGRNFRSSSEATTALIMNQGADFMFSELQPGIQKNGVQAFELPNDAFDGKLTLVVPEKGFFSSGEVKVNLGL
jgi:hypothetical protein